MIDELKHPPPGFADGGEQGTGALFRRLRAKGLAPAALDPDAEWVERRAKLFEAGEYPDKGVAVSPEQLRRLADGFDGPVPVLIEHAESPLELGFLTKVEALGSELFGTVALTREADALVERSGARSLSLGLSPDLSEIREVSLVRNPRIGSARLFSGDLIGEAPGDGLRASGGPEGPVPQHPGSFSASGDGRQASGGPEGPVPQHPGSFSASGDGLRASGGPEGTSPPNPPPQNEPFGEGGIQTSPPNPPPQNEPFGEGGSEWRERFEQLREEVDARDAERRVDGFMREGRLCPAQVPFALALMMASDTVEFGGDRRPLRELLIAMIERQPPMALFGELAPGSAGDGSAQLLMPEEAAFYRKHFPDVSLDEIARRRVRSD